MFFCGAPAACSPLRSAAVWRPLRAGARRRGRRCGPRSGRPADGAPRVTPATLQAAAAHVPACSPCMSPCWTPAALPHGGKPLIRSGCDRHHMLCCSCRHPRLHRTAARVTGHRPGAPGSPSKAGACCLHCHDAMCALRGELPAGYLHVRVRAALRTTRERCTGTRHEQPSARQRGSGGREGAANGSCDSSSSPSRERQVKWWCCVRRGGQGCT